MITQMISYACLAQMNRLLLQPFSGRISLPRMMAILPTFAFIEVAIPSAGASGVVLRVRYLGQSGYTPEASVFTLALESLYLGVIMTAASLLGLGYLLRSQPLSFGSDLVSNVVCVLTAGVDRPGSLDWDRPRTHAPVSPVIHERLESPGDSCAPIYARRRIGEPASR